MFVEFSLGGTRKSLPSLVYVGLLGQVFAEFFFCHILAGCFFLEVADRSLRRRRVLYVFLPRIQRTA